MRDTKIYDFNLLANGNQTLFVAGNYFRVLTSLGAVQIGGEFGNLGPLLQGQGLKNKEFTALAIKDLTGAANKGYIIVGDQDFVDDRIAGEVSIVDGGKARTLANLGFVGNAFCGTGAAQIPHCQLWNPAGSVKNLVVENFDVSSNTTGAYQFNIYNAALTTLQSNGLSKLSGGAASIAEVRIQTPAAELMAAFMGSGQLTANASPYRYDFREPIVLKPGFGLVTTMNITTTVNFTSVFQYYEDPI